MKVLNFGSLNVDYVYDVAHIVMPGETISSRGRGVFAGGKGLNQSVAMAKAGVSVYHAGSIGTDGDILLDALSRSGVNADFVYRQDAPGGHTVIQVDKRGQNCIIVYPGTNRMIPREYMDNVLSHFSKGDILLLQNEINDIAYLIDRAYEKGMQVALNPSPCDEIIATLPLEKVKYFIVNEIEGAEICGGADTHEDIIPLIMERYPHANILLTLGSLGSMYYDGTDVYRQDIFPVKAVDTTAAGDTFLGYFIYGVTQDMPVAELLRLAAKASSITVSGKGAAASIPTLDRVLEELA